jgi:hypothetical protein
MNNTTSPFLRLGPLLPQQVFYLGVFGLAGSMYILYKELLIASILLALISSLVVFARQSIKIDEHLKQIILQIKYGPLVLYRKRSGYNHPEKLLLKKAVEVQEMHSRGNSTVNYQDVYKGFLFADGQSFLILESKSEQYASKAMADLAERLKIQITTG